ncbi:MAG: TonB-dependent receptor [Chitinophagaceae bacterium]|nr:TonB-dependent receptor [Chitinophagaceae bacterium]
MNTKISLLLLSFISAISIAAQQPTGRISGKVINGNNGEPLIGATVVLQPSNRTITTDQNGTYSFPGIRVGAYSITCSYTGFQTKKIDSVIVTASEVTTQDVVMETKQATEIVIRGPRTLNRDNTSALLLQQKASPNMSDGISREAIQRTPDKNTSDVLKRVSGAAIQEDKFAVIRGLNDRYNAAFINGAPLPSSESDRKAFAFDIFPSNMLDNLIIYKTATPDLTGEFAGGAIIVNTRSIPTKDFQNISFGLGFNTQATFQQRETYKTGRWDFLGLDDGTRSLPSVVPTGPNFPRDNPEARVKLAKALPNDWKINSVNTMPNHSFQYTVGQNFQKNNKDFFGVLISATYSRSYNFSPGQRYSWNQDFGFNPVVYIGRNQYEEATSTVSVIAGLLANFSVKINGNNTISLRNLYSINSDDRVIRRSGLNDVTDQGDAFTKSNAMWFTSNQLFSSQLIGEHYIPGKTKLRINWVGSLANVYRNIPSQRRMTYDSIAGVTPFFAAAVPASSSNFNSAGVLFFSENKEKIYNGRLDLSRAFAIGSFLNNTFKAGIYYQFRDRNFAARQLGFTRYSFRYAGTNYQFDNNLVFLPQESIFSAQNMGRISKAQQTAGFLLDDATKTSDAYDASSRLMAYYGMLDQRFGKVLRLIYGVRLEDFTQKLFTLRNTADTLKINTNKKTLLPSVNGVVSFTPKMNLRLSYSKTVNRPEFRELAPFLFYDFVTRYSIQGNDTIKTAVIDNYDVRYEFYPGRAQLFSITGFYKKFVNPIELVSSPLFTAEAYYQNALQAISYGAEIELRFILSSLTGKWKEDLMEKFTLFSNLTLIKTDISLPTVTPSGVVTTIANRPLQGQSGYVFNSGISFNDTKSGYSAQLVANKIGDRVFIVGSDVRPDIWEKGRLVLDLQIARIIQKNIELKINFKDILAQQFILYNDYDLNRKYKKDVDYLISENQIGRVISFSVSYQF